MLELLDRQGRNVFNGPRYCLAEVFLLSPFSEQKFCGQLFSLTVGRNCQILQGSFSEQSLENR